MHADNKKLKIVIIGAGIGGLSAAYCLSRYDFDVHVYERAKELGEFGAGLQIGPNSVKIFRAIDLECELRKCTFEPQTQLSIHGVDGSLRFREPMKGVMEDKYDAPYLMAYRPDLHRLFYDRISADRIHLGKDCIGVDSFEDSATVTFSDGDQIRADIVIAADGIKSVIRKQCFGTDKPEFTEMIAWRAIVPAAAVPRTTGPNNEVKIDENDYFGWIGWNGHVVCYPIGDGSRVNIFAGHHSKDWIEESWSIPSTADEMISAYAGWNASMLKMFEHVTHCYKWGIFDRTPRLEWQRNTVILLGDAAHPTMPTLAQGANMAIEDGYTIARCLEKHHDNPKTGLSEFVRLRQPRTARITLQARQQFKNNLLRPPPPTIPRDWIFSFDATSGF